MIDPDELEDLVVGELGGSALFGARFRENAGRALLIPRAYPGRRTPLWQQRLKSQSLLEVARRYAQFPIVLETYREVLRDVLDLPGPARPADQAAPARALAGRGRDADRLAVRVLAAVRLRRDLHVRGRPAQRRAPRGGAGAGPRAAARAARAGGAARADRPGRAGDGRGRPAAAVRAHARGLRGRAARRAAPRRRPDAGRGEAARRHDRSGCEQLRGERRAIELRVGGEKRWVAAEDAGLYRDALGAVPPSGLARGVHRRRARTRWSGWCGATPARTGRSRRSRCATRYGLDLTPVLERLEQSGHLVRGELRPGGTTREWCDPEVLRRLRRASLAALRAEIEPADQRAFARFQGSWQGIDRHPPTGAGHRPAARGARAAAGPAAAAGGLGARRPAAPHRRLLAGVDGPAVRVGRDRVGRRRGAGSPVGPRGAVLPRRRGADRAAAAGRRGAVGAGAPGGARAPAGRRRASSPTC